MYIIYTHNSSKLSQRLRDARDLLSMTSLWTEAYKDVDLQYQHHVTVFLGRCRLLGGDWFLFLFWDGGGVSGALLGVAAPLLQPTNQPTNLA